MKKYYVIYEYGCGCDSRNEVSESEYKEILESNKDIDNWVYSDEENETVVFYVNSCKLCQEEAITDLCEEG